MVWIARRPLFIKYRELSAWGAGAYITAFCTYFSLYAGNIGSDYFNGLIQFYFGIAVMPLTTLSFFSITSLSLLAYVSTNLLIAGSTAMPPSSVISNLTPFIIFAVIVHILIAKIRAAMLDA